MDKVYACLLTIVLEILVICFFKKQIPFKKIITVSIILNIITNITLNLILGLFTSIWLYSIILIVLEVLVVISEAIVYNYFLKNSQIAYWLSISTNVFSLVIGSLILNILLSCI